MTDNPADRESLGSWLRRQRKVAGLTQEELAERSGLSARAIGNLERDRTRKPYPRSVRQMPLALAIAASRASGRPGLWLEALAQELKDAQRRLDVLETADAAASVRAVFSWSVGSLPAPAARMFRLLSLHPGPDITIPAAASLAGIPPPRARQALRELAEAHLIAGHAPGRFSLHDLLRAYSTEQAAEQEGETERRAAVQRTLGYYLRTTQAAALLLEPHRDPIYLSPACRERTLRPSPTIGRRWRGSQPSTRSWPSSWTSLSAWASTVTPGSFPRSWPLSLSDAGSGASTPPRSA